MMSPAMPERDRDPTAVLMPDDVAVPDDDLPLLVELVEDHRDRDFVAHQDGGTPARDVDPVERGLADPLVGRQEIVALGHALTFFGEDHPNTLSLMPSMVASRE
jgi:hypothetical protein